MAAAPAPEFADHHCPACGYALAGLTRRTCPECGAAFNMAIIQRARRRAVRRRWMISAIIMTVVLYAPFTWLLSPTVWSDSQHWLWLALWPILPGLPATILLRSAGLDLPDWIEFVCMGVVTCVAMITLTWLGTRGRWWLALTGVVAFVLSCGNGWIAFLLFQL